ncbi:ABC transporter substrate-binding protein [Bradyrhizobium sp. SSUT112]|uniref:ABC transporter substrate-binding protein n=1 Tax=Bradyrhizobium sp. SSUT112 TaxID=3040604 RepID=UPI0024470276|nr:ABC transporter substrate-binding protein [Bradyrhizobium sp. SSUT112]MDH2356527.1 ABC transporter substrate-binding protein [Bradyrhizobium sp. SSUT112]
MGDHVRVRVSVCVHGGFIIKLPNSEGLVQVEAGKAINVGWKTEDFQALVLSWPAPSTMFESLLLSWSGGRQSGENKTMKTNLMVAGALALTGLAVSGLTPVESAFASDQLTIVSWGGSYQAALRKAYFEPFTKATGIKLTEDQYSGEIAKVRAMVESKTVSWDVVDAAGGTAWTMCAQGLLETIDWKKVGLDRAKFGDAGKFDCGVPIQTNSTIVAYDKDRLPNAPKTIADLFDTKKFPGKRGLLRNFSPNLEWALIADGVPTKDVYMVLDTPDGVNRAFKKLDAIKKDVIWWTAGAQAPQLLADGQVIMVAAYHGRITDAVKETDKHFEIMWDAAQQGWANWTIPKGNPRLDDAYKFLAFAGAPQRQADLTRYIPYGPANRDAMALVDPAVLPNLPNTPDREAIALHADYPFMMQRGDELRQRFTAWLAK